jgi:hypothetical protein
MAPILPTLRQLGFYPVLVGQFQLDGLAHETVEL